MTFPVLDYASTTRPFVQYLEHVAAHDPSSIKAQVATDALDREDRPEDYFMDLLEHGCISGMVPSMVYYKDTHAFFDAHYNAIETLREEYQDATGESIIPNKPVELKNFLAWFAYEETARQLYHAFHNK